MNPWAVDEGCTPVCATHALSPVSPAEAARRCAALTYVIARGVSKGRRIAEPRELRAQARGMLDGLGVRLETGTGTGTREGAGAGVGAGPLSVNGSGTLVAANHISWLDVVALLAVEPVLPLAKWEVARWPVIGTLARRVGAPFIDRERMRQLPYAVADLTATLRSGRSVLVFPQATTWCSAPGGRFRRATFQAAADAGAPVRPVTVGYYQSGAPSTVAAFLGDEDFTTSLRRVASARDLTVRVTAHPALWGSSRRQLAAGARAAVCAAEPPAHVRAPVTRYASSRDATPSRAAGAGR
ncbi:lysophospholipid acyltransferase family protein [Streptomyces spiramyceticus]|uniref:lysophospholipid acyltransferase family protein n=1 Tax=Streptomyces spiramyceticus TaxID=299717 RepID=UPI00237A8E1D|nr:lysophospholipid acyltransferase family protein [Streptomyces spiramyceticus]